MTFSRENTCYVCHFCTWGGQQRMWRRGVWDAPQGQSACWVSLDQQLMERLPSAEEEPSHRRTDQELEDGWGGGGVGDDTGQHLEHLAVTFFFTVCIFFCLRATWSWNVWFCSLVVFIQKQQQHTANCMKNRTTHFWFTWTPDSSTGWQTCKKKKKNHWILKTDWV